MEEEILDVTLDSSRLSDMIEDELRKEGIIYEHHNIYIDSMELVDGYLLVTLKVVSQTLH